MRPGQFHLRQYCSYVEMVSASELFLARPEIASARTGVCPSLSCTEFDRVPRDCTIARPLYLARMAVRCDLFRCALRVGSL